MFYCIFFFFQAEDGIRDLVRSRGLGDVYKRQELVYETPVSPTEINIYQSYNPSTVVEVQIVDLEAVSYTHLTLPTIYSV